MIGLCCPQCNRPFYRHPSLLSDNNFCSRDCAKLWFRTHKRRTHPIKKLKKLLCDNCNAIIHRYPSAISTNNFCSQKCRGIWKLNHTPLNVVCAACSKPFHKKRIEIYKTRHNFCSRKCYGDWQRGKPCLNKNTSHKWSNEEVRSKFVEAHRKAWTPERKRQHSIIWKKRWADGLMSASERNLPLARGMFRSKTERAFCRYLRTKGFTFLENRCIPGIKAHNRQLSHRFDILFPDKKLAIEIDGTYWHNFPYGSAEDAEIAPQIEQTDWMLIRFWDFEVGKKPDECVEEIAYALSLNP